MGGFGSFWLVLLAVVGGFGWFWVVPRFSNYVQLGLFRSRFGETLHDFYVIFIYFLFLFQGNGTPLVYFCYGERLIIDASFLLVCPLTMIKLQLDKKLTSIHYY